MGSSSRRKFRRTDGRAFAARGATRREFLKAAGVGATFAMFPRLAARALSSGGGGPDRPNIVLIMADDLGFEKLGAYGQTAFAGPDADDLHTPNLDRLAEQGMRFEHCFSTPLCAPSRVEIMTGRYGLRNYRGFGAFKEGEPCFAQPLRDAGYATCLIGKWQLGGKVRPGDLGFDTWALRAGGHYWDRKLDIDDEKRVLYAGKPYAPDGLTQYGLDFISTNRKRRWMLYFPMHLVHAPFEPPSDAEKTGSVGDRPGGYGHQFLDDYYVAMVRYMDKLVGRIVRHLDDLGLRKNTLLLFTGDNGSHAASYFNGRRIGRGKGQMNGKRPVNPIWSAGLVAGRMGPCEENRHGQGIETGPAAGEALAGGD